jgi:hypothetical protein
LFDVISVRDAAIVNLSVLKEMPLPGGKEEKYLEELQDCSVETDESCGRSQRTNSLRSGSQRKESLHETPCFSISAHLACGLRPL